MQNFQLSTEEDIDQLMGKSDKKSNFNLTSSKAIQFQKEIESIDEMLINTNTINLDELRSACHDHQQQNFEKLIMPTNKTPCNRRYFKNTDSDINSDNNDGDANDIGDGYTPVSQTPPDPLMILEDTFYLINDERAAEGTHKDEMSLFDISKMHMAKQQNYVEAFERNLKQKKKEILHLEEQNNVLTNEQEKKLIRLSNFKNQRSFYQEQFKIAQQKRKNMMIQAKQELSQIEQKIQEYQSRYDEKLGLINTEKQSLTDTIAKLQQKNAVLDQKLHDHMKTPVKGTTNDEQNNPQGIKTVFNSVCISSFDSRGLCQSEEAAKKSMQKSIQNLRLSQEFIEQEPRIELKQKELEMTIQENILKVAKLHEKKEEVQKNLKELDSFLRQANEEMLMTNEDIQAKSMKKAEIVAMREELDQMYDSGKSAAGKEFELFMKLQEVSQAAGQNSSKFIQQEYDHLKALSFFNEIVIQMKNISSNQYEYLQIIQRKQEIVQNKGCFVEQEEIIQIINEMTTELQMSIDKSLLVQKFESSSREKDQIYKKRREKLNDIMKEIKNYEIMIKNYQNMIENILSPQMLAIEQTYVDHQIKFKNLNQALQVIDERLFRSQKDLKQMKLNYNMMNKKQAQIQSVKHITDEIERIENQILAENDKMKQVDQTKEKLDQDIQEIMQKLSVKKQEAVKIQNLYDPLNSTGQKKNVDASFFSEFQDLNKPHQDDHLRKILDEIDIKIGQAIEEKERENQKIKMLQKQIKEAKDSFSYAYKSMKQAKNLIKRQQNAILQQQIADKDTMLNKAVALSGELMVKASSDFQSSSIVVQEDDYEYKSIKNYHNQQNFSQPSVSPLNSQKKRRREFVYNNQSNTNLNQFEQEDKEIEGLRIQQQQQNALKTDSTLQSLKSIHKDTQDVESFNSLGYDEVLRTSTRVMKPEILQENLQQENNWERDFIQLRQSIKNKEINVENLSPKAYSSQKIDQNLNNSYHDEYVSFQHAQQNSLGQYVEESQQNSHQQQPIYDEIEIETPNNNHKTMKTKSHVNQKVSYNRNEHLVNFLTQQQQVSYQSQISLIEKELQINKLAVASELQDTERIQQESERLRIPQQNQQSQPQQLFQQDQQKQFQPEYSQEIEEQRPMQQIPQMTQQQQMPIKKKQWHDQPIHTKQYQAEQFKQEQILQQQLQQKDSPKQFQQDFSNQQQNDQSTQQFEQEYSNQLQMQQQDRPLVYNSISTYSGQKQTKQSTLKTYPTPVKMSMENAISMYIENEPNVQERTEPIRQNTITAHHVQFMSIHDVNNKTPNGSTAQNVSQMTIEQKQHSRDFNPQIQQKQQIEQQITQQNIALQDISNADPRRKHLKIIQGEVIEQPVPEVKQEQVVVKRRKPSQQRAAYSKAPQVSRSGQNSRSKNKVNQEKEKEQPSQMHVQIEQVQQQQLNLVNQKQANDRHVRSINLANLQQERQERQISLSNKQQERQEIQMNLMNQQLERQEQQISLMNLNNQQKRQEDSRPRDTPVTSIKGNERQIAHVNERPSIDYAKPTILANAPNNYAIEQKSLNDQRQSISQTYYEDDYIQKKVDSPVQVQVHQNQQLVNIMQSQNYYKKDVQYNKEPEIEQPALEQQTFEVEHSPTPIPVSPLDEQLQHPINQQMQQFQEMNFYPNACENIPSEETYHSLMLKQQQLPKQSQSMSIIDIQQPRENMDCPVFGKNLRFVEEEHPQSITAQDFINSTVRKQDQIIGQNNLDSNVTVTKEHTQHILGNAQIVEEYEMDTHQLLYQEDFENEVFDDMLRDIDDENWEEEVVEENIPQQRSGNYDIVEQLSTEQNHYNDDEDEQELEQQLEQVPQQQQQQQQLISEQRFEPRMIQSQSRFGYQQNHNPIPPFLYLQQIEPNLGDLNENLKSLHTVQKETTNKKSVTKKHLDENERFLKFQLPNGQQSQENNQMQNYHQKSISNLTQHSKSTKSLSQQTSNGTDPKIPIQYQQIDQMEFLNTHQKRQLSDFIMHQQNSNQNHRSHQSVTNFQDLQSNSSQQIISPLDFSNDLLQSNDQSMQYQSPVITEEDPHKVVPSQNRNHSMETAGFCDYQGAQQYQYQYQQSPTYIHNTLMDDIQVDYQVPNNQYQQHQQSQQQQRQSHQDRPLNIETNQRQPHYSKRQQQPIQGNNSKLQVNIMIPNSHHRQQQQQNQQHQQHQVPNLQLPQQVNWARHTFFGTLKPLLEGVSFYKKFSSRQTGLNTNLNEHAFDPLKADIVPPEQCGYGIRFVQLHRNLKYISIRQNLKNVIEYHIPIKSIVKPIIPATTMEIIKVQKQSCNDMNQRQSRENADEYLKYQQKSIFNNKKSSITHLAKIGVLNKKSELYKQKCLESTFYPFCLLQNKDILNEMGEGEDRTGRIELIATSYEILSEWITGINLLIKNKKELDKIAQQLN